MIVTLLTDRPVLGAGFLAALGDEPGVLPHVAPLGAPVAVDAIALVDQLPGASLAVASRLKESGSPVILWVEELPTEMAMQAIAMGVRGILSQKLDAGMLRKCLRKVDAGEFWFEQAVIDEFMHGRRVNLSKREGQMVALVSQGLTNRQIATILPISEGTAKVYLSRLFDKVGVKNRFELAIYGMRNLGLPNGPVVSAAPVRQMFMPAV